MNNAAEVSFPVPGAIDLHVHCSPDVRPRLTTALEVVLCAQQSGMRALVLKNHDVPTAAQAEILSQALSFPVFGGIVLNDAVGGFNPSAVETALRMGGKIVWMPTHCSHQERAYRGQAQSGLRIFDAQEQILPALATILAFIAKYNAILATGHLSAGEIPALVRAARLSGVKKILVNHPEIKIQQLSESLQAEVAGPDVFYERCYPRANFTHDWNGLARVSRHLGPSSTILATDLGQPDQIHPVRGLAHMQEEFLARGFSREEVRHMTSDAPARLLDLS